MKKVISFSSGKGGVGKTSLVANMGVLWAREGKKVLLVDGDWSLGKMALTLGVKPKWAVNDVLEGKTTMREAVQGVSEHLSLLASPSGVTGFEELSEEHRNQLFYELDSLQEDYDLILMDHSSGLHWGVIQFAAAAHQHVIVTTAEPTSYMDAYAIMKILSQRFRVRNFQLIVTMSQNLSETQKIIERFVDITQSHLEVKVTEVGHFLFEPKLALSLRQQKPFVSLYPEMGFVRDLSKVCKTLETTQNGTGSGLRFYFSENINPLAAR
ncbi:MAG: AAA family ATPase [Deltaproteobacteria bacterium]